MSVRTRTRRLTGVVLAGLIAALAVSFPATAGAASGKERPVKVMTRNLYLGADLTPAIQAGSYPALQAAGSAIWNKVQDTNFPARATVLAKEIVAADPTLIGLQEAAHWFTGAPDGIPGLIPGATPAATSSQDFLEILRSELAALGQPYDVVSSQDEANIEGPTNEGFDIRLLQRDVILIKRSMVDEGKASCTAGPKGNYANNLAFTLLGIPNAVVSKRGYVSADCTVNKRSFRFVDTHLEAYSPTYRVMQARQLLGLPVPPPFTNGPAGAAAAPGTTILVGDLNSDASDTRTPDGATLPPNNGAYWTFVGAAFADTWTAVNPPTTSWSLAEPGDTSGFSESVNDPDTSNIDSRIDHVMARGDVGVLKSTVTGLDPYNRVATSEGLLWPSDHAGVVATLQP